MVPDGRLHPVMPALIGYPTMWRHQQEVFEAVRRGEHVLVSTGTGSGKTEAFLYPLLDELLRERDHGLREGLKAILVYPMNALANDQLDRLREMLAGTEITFGLWIGSTPKTRNDVKPVDRFTGSSREAYLAERAQRARDAARENRSMRVLAPPEECCSEEEIRTQNPRILLTNYRQLEILSTRWPDVNHFTDAPLRYLVFDEAHTYLGAVGAEVACLIRRVRALAGKNADEVICIGTSATLTSPSPDAGDNQAAAGRFASRFFGVDPNQVRLITESYRKPQWPRERYRPAPPRGDGGQRLARLLQALDPPEDISAIQAIVEELTGWMFEAGPDWRESLYRLLLSNQYVYKCANLLKNARLLPEGAWQVSQRIAPGRFPQGSQCSMELMVYLLLGAVAQRDGQPLLRPKVHFFIRGLDEMAAAFSGDSGTTRPELFLSIQEGREAYPDRRGDAFFPVWTCRTCGQPFFEKHFEQLELQRNRQNKIVALAQGDATVDGQGHANAVWSPSTPDSGTRLLLTNRLLEASEDEENHASRSSKWITAWICRHCGALHRQFSPSCLAAGCGHPEPLLPLLVIAEKLHSCPSCGSRSPRIGGRTIEPARPVRAVTVSDVHILAQSMINAAPDRHKKLVIFADSRQEAAFQAGWMQDHARRYRLRHMMYEFIRDETTARGLEEIVFHLWERFRNEKQLIPVLLPELTGEDSSPLGPNRMKNVHRALRYLVIREFSTGLRRRDCLESMGLARIEYEGLRAQHPGVLEWSRMAGLSPDEAVNAIGLILDIWRRNRFLYVEPDPIYSRYHPKDDPYIQAGLLPLAEFHPRGLRLKKEQTSTRIQGLIAPKGQSALQALM
ncbi:MAG: DEAD/DEAH box helicase [bacterium]